MESLAAAPLHSTHADAAAPGVVSTGNWFPLTPLQEAYLVGQTDAYEMGAIPCLAYFAFEVRADDAANIEDAWNFLIARHPMLRAVISLDEGQRILDEVPRYRVERFVDAGLQEIADRFLRRHHDPAVWPLSYCAVSRAQSDRPVVHIGINILIADGHSIQILLHDLRRHLAGLPPQPASIDYAFRDYGMRLARARRRGFDRSKAYWEQRLAVPADPPGLALAMHPSQLRAPAFRRFQASLGADAWAGLKQHATQHKLTPTAVFLASFAQVLADHARRDRFSLGVTLFKRPEWHPAIKDVVGDFTGLLRFIVELPDDAPFVERALKIQSDLWSDISNHDPASSAAWARQREQARGEAPSGLPVVFTSLLGEPRDIGDWKLVDGLTQTPQVWIDHQVVETPDDVLFYWDAADNLFPPGGVARMFEAHAERIRALAAGSGWSARRNVERLPSPPLRAGLLPIAPDAVHDMRPAVLTADARLEHRTLRALAGSTSRALALAGASRGDRVAIFMSKGWEQIVAVHACTAMGCVYVPLSPDLPASRIRFLIETCDIRVALTRRDDGPSPGLPDTCARIVVPDIEAPHESHALPTPSERTHEDLAYIIFTSGSTGQPKGVAVSHGAVHNTIVDMNDRFHVGPDDRILSLSSLSFDLSVYDAFGPVAAGGAVVIPDQRDARDPQSWVSLMVRAEVTVWNTVPALMAMLVEFLEADESVPRPGLRLVLLSGDWIPVGLPDRIRALFPSARIVSLGGATEASIWSVFHDVVEVDPRWKSIPYGKALGGQTIDVYDERLSRLPDGVVGEICIGGGGLAAGYWKDAEQTAERFVKVAPGERLYRTGDLGRRHPDGTLEMLGREDGQVKINGFRVELGEIESALSRQPGVLACGATVRDRQLHAHVVMQRSEAFDEEALRSAIGHELPDYLVPVRIGLLDRIPLSSNGKVDRAALPSLREQREAATDAAVADWTPSQRTVCAFAEDLIGIASAQPSDDFFRLGGSSIQLVRLHQRLQRHFASSHSLRDLVADTQLAAIARLMDASGQSQSTAELTARFVAEGESAAPFAMTPVQQAYWLGRRGDLALGGVAPHVYVELSSPDWDPARVERTWNTLVRRHAALRTIVTEEARQTVLAQVPSTRMDVIDLRGLSPSEREAHRESIRRRMSHQVFEPETWPMFELALSVDNHERTLHVSLDLMIGDAWSMQILAREFARAYAADGAPDALGEPLAASFRDWITWRAAQAAGPRRERSLAYWRSRCLDLPGPPHLPVRRDGLGEARFARRRHTLDRAAWQAIRARAAEQGVTAVNALMSTFSEALTRCGAGDQFLLNVTFFDREELHPDLAHMVGDFTSLLLVACRWLRGEGFASNARRLQQALFEAMDHASVSAVEVVRMAAGERQLAAPVVFTSTLGVADTGDAERIDLPGEEIYSISQTPQVWLDHQVSERDGELHLVWDFRCDLLDAAYVDALVDIYIARISQLGEAGPWQSHGAEATGERRDPAPAAGVVATSTDASSAYLTMYRERPALRRDEAVPVGVALEGRRDPPFPRRVTSRRFAPRPVQAGHFGSWLSCLVETADAHRFTPRRAYASAGSLYPVQVYVVLRAHAVEGLEAGTYYYRPDLHELRRTGPACTLPPGDIDAPIALLLVAEMRAIEPIYGEKARDFALIEAGLMAQTLELQAAELGLGTCQLGWPAPEDWRACAVASATSMHLHTIACGALQDVPAAPAAGDAHREPPPVSSSPPGEAPPHEDATQAMCRVLVDILKDVLAQERLDADTHLFRVGGDSVHAVRACAQASKVLGFPVPLRDLLENPTPRTWALALARRRSKAQP